MQRHDKHLLLLLSIVVVGMIGCWIKVPEAHDVTLLALGGLLVEVQIVEKNDS